MKMKRVYPSLNKLRTIWGVERKGFFFILTISFGLFHLSEAIVPALILFVVLLLAARWATRFDPQILRIVMNSHRFSPRYDPAKWKPFEGMKGVPRGATGSPKAT